MAMKIKRTALRGALGALLCVSLVVWRGAGGTVNFTYDAAGRLTAANYGGTTNSSYAYDPAGNLILASAPTPALIVGPVVAGRVTLAWSAAPGGFILQHAITLKGANAWTDAPVTPIQEGAFIVVRLSAGSGATFFRLRQGP